MTNSIQHLHGQFELQTRLFKNVTEGITDTDAGTQMNPNTNHIAWVAGHVVSTRIMLANVLGAGVKEPFPEFYENGKSIDPSLTYPSMKDLLKDWERISEKIASAMEALTEDTLNQKIPRAVPTGDTLGNFIAFILHHESYHIGQLGIARRYFGLEAMKYN